MPYSGNPAASPADRLRFLIGDTGTPPILTDLEINALLAAAGGSADAAAPDGAEAIAAKFSSGVDYTSGRVSRSLSQRIESYYRLARTLRAKAALLAVPVNTGHDKAADRIDGANAAIKQPQFTLGQFDNPEVVRPGVVPPDDDLQP